MKNKYKLTALLVALSLGFAGCAQEAGKKVDDAANDAKEKVEEVANDAKDTADEAKEDAKDLAEDAKDEAKDKASDALDKAKSTLEGKLVLRRSLRAAHGEGSFARVAVITDGDKIVDAAIDEFQYFDEGSGFLALPNQDEDTEFKSGNKEGKFLGSKVMNDEKYSALMKEKAKATVSIADNYKAIQNFAKGKTIDELKKVVAGAEPGKAIDSVTGATLVDTKGYLEAIIETAEDDENTSVFEANKANDIQIKQSFGTAGNKNAITDTFVVMEDGKIIAANIDEYQYMEGKGVPNSDKKFGENYADSKKVLASKLENNEAYSKQMKDIAKAKHTLRENLNSIEAYVVGKTPEEIKGLVDGNKPGKPVDAISEATLSSTVGYLDEIYKTATK